MTAQINTDHHDLPVTGIQALAALKRRADSGQPLPTGEELRIELGRNDEASARRTVRKLEERGLVTRDPFAVTLAGHRLLADTVEAIDETRPVVTHGMIDGFPFNPRSTFDEAAIAELAASIRDHRGTFQPIIIRPHPDKPGLFQGIAGERRWRAIDLLIAAPDAEGFTADTALFTEIRNLSDVEARELAIAENINRADVSPVDEAAGITAAVTMRVEAGMKQSDAYRATARAIGKTKRYAEIAVQLMTDLDEAVRTAWRDGHILKSHALEIARAPRDDQRAILPAILRGDDGYRGASAIAERVKERKAAREAPELFSESAKRDAIQSAPDITLADVIEAAFDAAAIMGETWLAGTLKRNHGREQPLADIDAAINSGILERTGPPGVGLVMLAGADAEADGAAGLKPNEHGAYIDAEREEIWSRPNGHAYIELRLCLCDDGYWRAGYSYSFAESGGSGGPNRTNPGFIAREDARFSMLDRLRDYVAEDGNPSRSKTEQADRKAALKAIDAAYSQTGETTTGGTTPNGGAQMVKTKGGAVVAEPFLTDEERDETGETADATDVATPLHIGVDMASDPDRTAEVDWNTETAIGGAPADETAETTERGRMVSTDTDRQLLKRLAEQIDAGDVAVRVEWRGKPGEADGLTAAHVLLSRLRDIAQRHAHQDGREDTAATVRAGGRILLIAKEG